MESGLSSPTTSSWRIPTRRSCRRIDKLICATVSYFPLFFVYSATTWAAYTTVYSICWQSFGGLYGKLLSSG